MPVYVTLGGSRKRAGVKTAEFLRVGCNGRAAGNAGRFRRPAAFSSSVDQLRMRTELAVKSANRRTPGLPIIHCRRLRSTPPACMVAGGWSPATGTLTRFYYSHHLEPSNCKVIQNRCVGPSYTPYSLRNLPPMPKSTSASIRVSSSGISTSCSRRYPSIAPRS